MSHMVARRSLLTSAAALPFAAAAPAWSAAPMLGASSARHHRFALGGFEVTTLLAASSVRDDPHSIFGLDVDDEEFRAVSEAAHLPTDQAVFFFTPTVVNTGEQLVLFDTGLSAEGITSALEGAGYTPDQVDVVVITHMHPDHIGGLMKDGAPTFPNAAYATGAVEFDAWAERGAELFESNMRPLADKTQMIEDGASLVSGHTAMAAFGHTPGHMVHMLESEGERLLLIADLANHPVWSLARPDWEVRFDMDKEAAAAARKRVLGMLASDRIPMIGYHMPFPAIGFVEANANGFRYVPSGYQHML